MAIAEGLVTNDPVDARHLVIDPYQTTRYDDLGMVALEEAGLAEVVELLREESQIALPRLLRDGRAFGFAFVDGNPFTAVSKAVSFCGANPRLVGRGGVS